MCRQKFHSINKGFGQKAVQKEIQLAEDLFTATLKPGDSRIIPTEF